MSEETSDSVRSVDSVKQAIQMLSDRVLVQVPVEGERDR